MKPVLAHYPVTGDDNFFAAIFDYPYNPTPLHYHPEYELVYIIQGSGTKFIGDSLGEFNKGELCLIGSNLPHLYRNHKEYYDKKSKLRHQSITVHFKPEAFGPEFLSLPLARKVKKLLQDSQYGIDFTGYRSEQLIQNLFQLPELKGLAKLVKLLEILDELSHCKQYKLITADYVKGTDETNPERLKNIIQFLLTNFAGEISLQQVADIACMSRTSTCRFFKERTKQSLWDFLGEIRLNHAARLLRETPHTILSISNQSGFKNVTHFNRLFLQKFACSPKQYRNENVL